MIMWEQTHVELTKLLVASFHFILLSKKTLCLLFQTGKHTDCSCDNCWQTQASMPQISTPNSLGFWSFYSSCPSALQKNLIPVLEKSSTTYSLYYGIPLLLLLGQPYNYKLVSIVTEQHMQPYKWMSSYVYGELG